jgi:hypothetical protein
MQLQRQEGAGERAGNGDALVFELAGREGFARDDQRAVAIADARAVRQQRIVVGNVGVGVKGDGRHVVFLRRHRNLIERLDVFEDVGEFQLARVEFVGGEAIKHEGVVGIGTVCNFDFAFGH